MTSPNIKTTPRVVALTQKAAQALALRKAGATYDEIAVRVGYSGKSNAYRAVSSALRRMLQEPAEDVRKLELARVDQLMLAIWPKATSGDLQALDRVLKLLERRARLLGLDLQPEHEQADTVINLQVNYGAQEQGAQVIEGEVVEEDAPELPARKNGKRNGDGQSK